MLQRNISPYTLALPTLDPPAEVEPGGTIDFATLLAGFEEVTGDEAEADTGAEKAPAVETPPPSPAQPNPPLAPAPPGAAHPAPLPAPVSEPGGTTTPAEEA